MRRSILVMALGTIWLSLMAAGIGLAAEVPDTGRKKIPTSKKVEKWTIQLNGGLLKGGDLFRASNSTGEPVAWVPEGQGDWLSHRIKVHFESSFALGLQLQRRLGEQFSLRAGFSYSDTKIVAEAPVEEWAQVFPYDTADIWLFSLGTEVRLTHGTLSYPYAAFDVLMVGLSPQRSGFLSQTNLGGRLALGYHHQFDPMWFFGVEAGLSRSAMNSGEIFPLEDIAPADLQYDTENHLTMFEVKFSFGLKI